MDDFLVNIVVSDIFNKTEIKKKRIKGGKKPKIVLFSHQNNSNIIKISKKSLLICLIFQENKCCFPSQVFVLLCWHWQLTNFPHMIIINNSNWN